jgi:hypothetical protein
MPTLNEFGFVAQKSKNISKTENNDVHTYCLEHLRAHIEDVAGGFKSETNFLLERLVNVFDNDRLTEKMSDDKRLDFHQRKSAIHMQEIFDYVSKQRAENKKAEPNCEYGKLLSYITGHWEGFTAFLRIPGVELTTNDVEGGAKFTKRHKKNSLSYQTCFGADVGCFFMSLIATCLALKKNPLHYLTTIIANAHHISATTAHLWTPHRYQDTIKNLSSQEGNKDGYTCSHKIKKDPDAPHKHPPRPRLNLRQLNIN